MRTIVFLLMVTAVSAVNPVESFSSDNCNDEDNGTYGEKAELSCHFPDSVNIYWYKKIEEGPLVRLEGGVTRLGPDSVGYNISNKGDLIIIKTDWHHEQEYLVMITDGQHNQSPDVPVHFHIKTGCLPTNVKDVGQNVTLRCDFKPDFESVNWFDGEGEKEPLIQLVRQGNSKNGTGYIRGEYDITNNGSLVINNVSTAHIFDVFVVYHDSYCSRFKAVLTVKGTLEGDALTTTQESNRLETSETTITKHTEDQLFTTSGEIGQSTPERNCECKTGTLEGDALTTTQESNTLETSKTTITKHTEDQLFTTAGEIGQSTPERNCECKTGFNLLCLILIVIVVILVGLLLLVLVGILIWCKCKKSNGENAGDRNVSSSTLRDNTNGEQGNSQSDHGESNINRENDTGDNDVALPMLPNNTNGNRENAGDRDVSSSTLRDNTNGEQGNSESGHGESNINRENDAGDSDVALPMLPKYNKGEQGNSEKESEL